VRAGAAGSEEELAKYKQQVEKESAQRVQQVLLHCGAHETNCYLFLILGLARSM